MSVTLTLTDKQAIDMRSSLLAASAHYRAAAKRARGTDADIRREACLSLARDAMDQFMMLCNAQCNSLVEA
jgi:hypothetical protein